jgi:hypothetical protein
LGHPIQKRHDASAMPTIALSTACGTRRAAEKSAASGFVIELKDAE